MLEEFESNLLMPSLLLFPSCQILAQIPYLLTNKSLKQDDTLHLQELLLAYYRAMAEALKF